MLGSFSEMPDPYGPTVRAASAAADEAVMVVDIHVSSAVFDLLPADLTKKAVPVVPVLFTQVGATAPPLLSPGPCPQPLCYPCPGPCARVWMLPFVCAHTHARSSS